MNSGDPGTVPRDARHLHLIMTAQGVPAYESRVRLQLMDFMHQLIWTTLQDAQAYAQHRNAFGEGLGTLGNNVSMDDVQLAIASRVRYSFSNPPSKEFMLSLATERNRMPLPPVLGAMGLRVPEERWWMGRFDWDDLYD